VKRAAGLGRRRLAPLARLSGALAAVIGLLVVVALPLASSPADATPAAINGSGSSYVALAMQQWVAQAQTNGLSVNYLPTGSPQGLTSFGENLIDFAGTEAEFSSLSVQGGEQQRGYQYVPDVAGAVSIMYNVNDVAGNKVDYLHLSPRTVDRIFMGQICNWSDPQISADNKGLKLPNEPITVVYRGGQSGTTGLFYDFVANTDPGDFTPWAAKNQFPTRVRIIQLDSSPGFACHTQAFTGSDQIAQYLGSPSGQWGIGYDEFGYALTYHVPAAWIENGAGQWVQPYAANISAALESAKLRPDLSQDLTGVYTSKNPIAYPISAYSYLVTQCAPAVDRATCKGAYTNPGITETLAKWMRYIACDGQVQMAQIGYSPLPPNLSQEMSNSIARMEGNGAKPEILTAQNCANPRFKGNLGAGSTSPADPLANVSHIGPASSGSGSVVNGNTSGGAATVAGGAARRGKAGSAAAGGSGNTAAALSAWRDLDPVAYTRPLTHPGAAVPLLVLLGLVIVPTLVFRRRHRVTADA
jgi:phosphate transport system substrate-binding protein